MQNQRILKWIGIGACVGLIVLTAVLSVFVSYAAFLGPKETGLSKEPAVPVQVQPLVTQEPPQNIKAFYLTPGTDFYKKETDTREEISKQISQLLTKLKEMEFNALVVDTKLEDGFVYSGGKNAADVDALSLVVELADEQKIPVYPIYYLNAPASDTIGLAPDGVESQSLVQFICRYRPEGVFLTDYYLTPSAKFYQEYSLSGESKSYAAWLADRNTYRISQAIDAAKLAAQQEGLAEVTSIGLLADPVWADASQGGPKVKGKFSALSQGYADTKKLIETGQVDFFAVKVYTSLTDPDQPFGTVVNWWGNLAETGNLPMFVLHDGNRVGGTQPGWNGYDQLARQVASANKAKGYSGSIFSGVQKLLANPSGSTDILLKYYRDEYKENDLFQDVTITSPSKTTFTTQEAKVRFHGKYDPNFEVTINDKVIVPTQSGEFLEDYDLKIGVNKFVIKHKGKTLTYTITRTVKVLKSVSPSGNMTVDGGTQIILEVVAYKGSTVTASLGGKTYRLEQISGGDNIDQDSSYGVYGATVTAPLATSKNQSLGRLKVTGKYSGYTETMNGGTVTVKKRVEDTTTTPETPYDPNAPEPEVDYDVGTQVMFKNDYTVIYDGNVAGAEYGSAQKNTLPKGTIDYIQSTTSEYYNFFDKGRINFYILKSGKKVKTSAVTSTGGIAVGNNHLSNYKLESNGQFTTLQFATKWKAPLDVSFDGVKYHSMGSHLYFVDSFNPKTVTVTFDYATMAPVIPEEAFTESPLFSKGSWSRTIENGVPKMRLKLTLRQSGGYYGCAIQYDAQGNLVLKFNNPPKTLEGMKIVIDPGHGKGDSGAVGSYTQNGKKVIVYERDLNWKVANYLKEALEAEGATVLMYNSQADGQSGSPSLEKRVAYGRKNQPHLYIAVHHNAGSSTAKGAEVYYTNPFSKPFAKSINTRLNNYFKNTIYGGGSISNLQDKYSEFRVTRVHEYAALLVEYGFVSNHTELSKLNNPTYQKGLANATVQGIKDALK